MSILYWVRIWFCFSIQYKFSNVHYFVVSLKRLSEFQPLRFKERTITDYAILENSIAYDLDAATVCFFAKYTDPNPLPNVYTFVYSYAYTGDDNELLVCQILFLWLLSTIFPVLVATVNNIQRYFICTLFVLKECFSFL